MSCSVDEIGTVVDRGSLPKPFRCVLMCIEYPARIVEQDIDPRQLRIADFRSDTAEVG